MRSKVKEAARELGLQVELRTLDESTRTVPEAAAAVGCEIGQIAKTIVFVMDGEPVVVVASGRHRIDPDKVCDALDCAESRQASADEVRADRVGDALGGGERREASAAGVRAAPGSPVGGAPPIGHGLPVVFDSVLFE